MLCCFGPSFPYYSPVGTDEKEITSQRRLSSSQRPNNDQSCFPCMRRSASTEHPPRGSFLIKTGGNALQAIPRDAALEINMVAVSVPENVNPGQEILVTAPDGSGRCMRATVPDGALPGHTFLVRMETPPVVAVTGIPVENVPHDLLLTPESNEKKKVEPHVELMNFDHFDAPQQPQPQPQTQIPPPIPPPQMQPQAHQRQQQQPRNSNDNRVLVRVPPGVSPGSEIRVKIPDGRVIEATVPPGEATQFYVNVPPKKQNWHDNPLAYAAPMAVAPFFV